MKKISVSPEELRSQAQVYNEACAQLDEARNRINAINGQMAEQWRGQAFERYLQMYDEVCTHFDRYREVCVEIYNRICKAADTMEEADQTVSTLFEL